jgi:hypothetical protein
MKALLIAGFTAAALAAIVIAARVPFDPTRVLAAAAQPWQVGQCYRVFPADRDTFYTFKVLDAPEGPWVRVQSVPASPPVPGANPPVVQWLNSTSAFMVQQSECPE